MKINYPRTNKPCEICGVEMLDVSVKQRYCSECKKKKIQENNLRQRLKRKELLENRRKAKSINQILAELKAYNETHGTYLTYGQYVNLLYTSGKEKRKNGKSKI